MHLQTKISSLCLKENISIYLNKVTMTENKYRAEIGIRRNIKGSENFVNEDFIICLDPQEYDNSILETTVRAKAFLLNQMYPEAGIYDAVVENKQRAGKLNGPNLSKKVDTEVDDLAETSPVKAVDIDVDNPDLGTTQQEVDIEKKATKKKVARKKVGKKKVAKKQDPKAVLRKEAKEVEASVSFELFDKSKPTHSKILNAALKPILGNEWSKDDDLLAAVSQMVREDLHGKVHVLKDKKPMKSFLETSQKIWNEKYAEEEGEELPEVAFS